MRLSSSIKLAVFVWLCLEIVVFGLVADLIGVPRAILLGVITSLLGLTLLRRAGTAALLKLRARLGDRLLTQADAGSFLHEMLATAGALALLLPGFLSDLVGLALAVPVVRDRVVRWADRKGWIRAADVGTGKPSQSDDGRGEAAGMRAPPRHAPATIDLEPDEWKRTDPMHRPRS